MKIIFFGLGSIGVRHVKVLQKLFKFEICAFRSDKDKNKNALGIPEVYRWSDVRKLQPDVAFITNPTSIHIETAIQCAEEGMHLFIEKPLDSQIKHLPRLLKIVSRKRIATYVAYVLRFHPVIRQLKKYAKQQKFLHMRVIASSYLPSWTPKRNHLERYSAQARMGGGVIYDLSHELDYTEYILGKVQNIEGKFDKRGNVTADAEDYADMLVETDRGPANIHVNFLSHRKQRMIQMDFKDKFVEGDILDNSIVEYRAGKIVNKYRFTDDLNMCFEKQCRYFFSHMKNRRMMNDVFEASHLFREMVKFKNAH